MNQNLRVYGVLDEGLRFFLESNRIPYEHVLNRPNQRVETEIFLNDQAVGTDAESVLRNKSCCDLFFDGEQII